MSNDQSFKNREPAMGKADPGTIKRIFGYIFQYKWRVVAIVVCILVGASITCSLFFTQGCREKSWKSSINPYLTMTDSH